MQARFVVCMGEPTEDHDPTTEQPRRTVGGGVAVKRRWAIVSKAGGGVAVIAIVGALAAGAPANPASSDGVTGADNQERLAAS